MISLTSQAFNSRQAADVVGITPRQLRYWDQKGLVKPSVRPAAGRGSQRLYSYADLLALKVMQSLRADGISLQRVTRCVRYLRAHMPAIAQPLGFCSLLTDGQTVWLVEDERSLIDTCRNQGQRAMIQLSIAALDRELRSRVVRIAGKQIAEVRVGNEMFQVEIEPESDGDGYAGEVAGLPGCITQGETAEEVVENAADAIAAYLATYDELAKAGKPVPKVNRNRVRKSG